MNDQNKAVEDALKAYNDNGLDKKYLLRYFLADFMHYCDFVDLDFNSLLDNAKKTYEAEVRL